MQKIFGEMKNLKVIKNPVVGTSLAILRDKNSNSATFRSAVEKIAGILFYEAVKNLPTMQKRVQTPLESTFEDVISSDISIIISPILRAGLAFVRTALDILPSAKVFHIGMYRDEETLEPVWYYNKLHENIKNPKNTYVYITDPMLATGGSLLEALKLYTEKNIPQKNIKAVCLICSPEGVSRIRAHFPDVEIYTAALDRTLNNKGYILPGLGDAGDRIFNTL